jgi:hypothetical protein
MIGQQADRHGRERKAPAQILPGGFEQAAPSQVVGSAGVDK